LKSTEEKVDRLEVESDGLRKEISRLAKSNERYSTLLTQTQTENSLSTSSVIPLKLELTRLQQELDALTAHTNYIEGELASKNDNISNLRSNHSMEVRNLRKELDRVQLELSSKDRDLESARSSGDHTSAEVEKLRKKLYDKEVEFSNERETLLQDLNKERELVSLKEQRMLLAEDQKESLLREVEELKALAKEATEEAATQAEEYHAKLKEDINNAVATVKEEERLRREALEDRLKTAEEAKRRMEDDILNTSTPLKRRRRIEGGLTTLSITEGGEEDGPLSLTDLYAHLAETEDELRATQHKNKKLEIILGKIHRDIAEKTPLYLQQKIELQNTLEELEETKDRLNHARREVADIRADLEDVELKNKQVERECLSLQRENKDLASQVQSLLRSRSSSDDIMDVDDNVTFDSVEKLQEQNQKLLQDHHSMRDKIQELEEHINTNPEKLELDELKSEVVGLREEREKQTKAIAGIVHQRDLYRALVAKNDASSLGNGEDQLAVADSRAELLPSIESKSRALVEEVGKLRAEVSGYKHEKEDLESRLARIDSHADELTSSNERLRSELISANSTVARMEIDVSHFRGRCERLENSLEAIKMERDSETNGKNRMEELNTKLQDHLEIARNELAKKEQQHQSAMSRQRSLEAQLQSAKAAEERISSEANSLRAEIARQGALLGSVQRIEASLTAKAEGEREHLVEEVKRLTDKILNDESKHNTMVQKFEGRVADLEHTIKNLTTQRDTASSALAEANEEVSSLKLNVKEINLKFSTTEKELKAAKQKLGDISIDTSAEEALEAKVASLTKELETAKARMADYQAIAKNSEFQLAELTAASTKYKEETSATLERLRKSEQAKTEAVAELTNDLMEYRSEKDKAVNDLKAKIESLTTELASSKEDAASARGRVDDLTSEMKSYQINATNAQTNYERELALHAEARNSLREARSEMEESKRLREIAESRLADLTSGIEAERESWQSSKVQLEKSLEEANSRLQELRNQNNILHEQLSSLSATVEKIQSEKTSQFISEETGETEASNLKAQISDLRELLRFKQSECTMLEADLASAKRATERERTAAESAKRSLEETRSELKVLLENNKSTAGEVTEGELSTLKQKLSRAEDQLVLVGESNKTLREESERAKKKLSEVSDELTRLKASSAPNTEKIKSMEVEKATLEAEKASLSRDLDAWKKRVSSLVSKFNQIDPEEHAQALANIEKLQGELSTLKSAKDKAEKDCSNAKNLVSRLNKEVSSMKASMETLKLNLENATSEKEKLTKSAKSNEAAAKEITAAKEATKKVEEQLKAAKIENDGLNGRVANFKKMLSKLQKGMKDAQDAEVKAKSAESGLQKEIADLKQKLQNAEKSEPKKLAEPQSQGKDPENVAKVGTTKSQELPPPAAATPPPQGTPPSFADVKESATTPAEPTQPPPSEVEVVPTESTQEAPTSDVTTKSNLEQTQAETDTSKQSTVEDKTTSGLTPKKTKKRKATVPLKATQKKTLSTTTTQNQSKTVVAKTDTPTTANASKEEEMKMKMLMLKKKKLAQKLELAKKKQEEEKDEAPPSAEATKQQNTRGAALNSPKLTGAPAVSGSEVISSEGEKKTANEVSNETEKATSTATTETSSNIFGQGFNPKIQVRDANAVDQKPAAGSGTFLNLIPPGKSGTTAPFVFGKSANITLSAPAGATPLVPSKGFGGVFGQKSQMGLSPFGGSTVFGSGSTPFGGDNSKKRPLAKEDDKQEEGSTAKQSRTGETQEAGSKPEEGEAVVKETKNFAAKKA